MIDYKVHSGSTADEALVARYWAMGDNGKFVEPVSSLFPYGEIENSQQLIKYINGVSSAWSSDRFCPNCQSHVLLRSRADLKSQDEQRSRLCKSCTDKDVRKLKNAELDQSAKLAKKLLEVTERNLSATIEYEDVPSDVALLLIALHRVINPRLLTGSFMRGECQGLAPMDSEKFVQRLWDAKVILDLPNRALAGAYFFKDEDLWHYSNKVAYVLVSDAELGRGEQSFDLLTSRDFSDSSELRQLWLDYAVCDGLAYLLDQCGLHNLEISAENDTEIRSILRTALQVHSVAQIWSVIWKVVRDAASLSTREYYNKTKAAGTIPGKISRQIERIVKGDLVIKPWRRPADQPAGALGEVFYEYFGIDEGTTGLKAMEMFIEHEDEAIDTGIDPPLEFVEEQVCLLMRRAIACNLEAEIILFFADCVRGGNNVKTALDAVFSAYPRLSE